MRASAVATAALALAACTSGDPSPDAGGGTDAAVDAEAGDASESDAGLPGSAATIGAFQVRLVAPADPTPGYTTVFGKVYDGPTPVAIVWEETAAAGECRLLRPRVPFCSAGCPGGGVCVEDDVCAAYPASRSVGRVTLTGVRTAEGGDTLTLDPVASNYQSPSLPYPAFAAGDRLSLSAAGGDFAPFTVEARGIAPLVVTSTSLALERGRAFAVSWEPAADPSISSVHLKLDVSHHGGSKGMIECTLADDGAAELAVTLGDRLLDLGVAGFPSVVLTRLSRGVATVARGQIELAVSSIVEQFIDIPGLVSCTADEECEPGTTCQRDLTCR